MKNPSINSLPQPPEDSITARSARSSGIGSPAVPTAALKALNGQPLITPEVVEQYDTLEALIVNALPFQQIFALGTLYLDFAEAVVTPAAVDLMYTKYPAEFQGFVQQHVGSRPLTDTVRRRLSLLALGTTCRDFAKVFGQSPHDTDKRGLAPEDPGTIADYQVRDQARDQAAAKARAEHNKLVANGGNCTHWI